MGPGWELAVTAPNFEFGYAYNRRSDGIALPRIEPCFEVGRASRVCQWILDSLLEVSSSEVSFIFT